MSDAPLTDFQIALSKAVDLARALPPGSVNEQFWGLVGIYISQIIGAAAEARQ